MTILKITAVGTDGSRVTLWFDDGTKMKVASRVVADRGLYQGMELDEEDLASLLDTAQKASAKDRAVRIVSPPAFPKKNSGEGWFSAENAPRMPKRQWHG